MEIDITKIVSSDELAINTMLIKNKLSKQNEMIVFENNQPQFVIITLEKYRNHSSSNIQQKEQIKIEAIKIGKLVQDSFRKLIFNNKLPEDEIKRLCSEEYSYNNFNLNYSVLKLYNDKLTFDEQKRDANGYNRYYNFTLEAYGNNYLLCSQFVEYLHRDKLEKWLKQWDSN